MKRTVQSPSLQTTAHFATRVKAAHLRRESRSQRGAPLRTALFAGAFATAAAAGVALLMELSFPAHPSLSPRAQPAAMATAAAPAIVAPVAPAAAESEEDLATRSEADAVVTAWAEDSELAVTEDDELAEPI